MKIGMTGSELFLNKILIKDIIFKLKNKFGDITIIGGGTRNGVDLVLHKICTSLEVPFRETRPLHEKWSPYCIEPMYMYNKAFSARNFYIRNNNLIKNSDIIVIFLTKEDTSNVLIHLIDLCNKKNKKNIIFSS